MYIYLCVHIGQLEKLEAHCKQFDVRVSSQWLIIDVCGFFRSLPKDDMMTLDIRVSRR